MAWEPPSQLPPPPPTAPTPPPQVFGSIYRVLKDLQRDGYDVGPLPLNEEALIKSVLTQAEAKFNSADLNIAYKMSVDEYQKLCP